MEKYTISTKKRSQSMLRNLQNIVSFAKLQFKSMTVSLSQRRGSNVVLLTTRFSNGDSRVLFFSLPYSVKTTSLPHTPNNLFDQI